MEGVLTCIEETELRVLASRKSVLSLCSETLPQNPNQQTNNSQTRNWLKAGIVQHLISSKHTIILCVRCILRSRSQSTCCRFCITVLRASVRISYLLISVVVQPLGGTGDRTEDLVNTRQSTPRVAALPLNLLCSDWMALQWSAVGQWSKPWVLSGLGWRRK